MVKRGRPNAYMERIEPRRKEIIEWARAGATNKEIAIALGIGYSTFQEHIAKHPDFSEALKEARLSGVPMVKLALYRRAVGFEYEERKISQHKDEDGTIKDYVEVTKKQALPDVGACQVFLRNNTEDFRDKDKFTYDFKNLELELKREIVKQNDF